MNIRVAAFVDHEIGYRLLEKMTSAPLAQRMQLAAVVTTRENGSEWWPGVEALCRAHALPLLRYDDAFDISQIPAPVDAALLLSWKHLLPATVYAWPRLGTVNLHYSLLPELRGVYPVNWALIEGRSVTGVSFHRVDATIDGGGVLLQRQVSVAASDTSRSLQLKLDDAAFDLFDDLVELLPTLATAPASASAPEPGTYRSRKDFERAREIHPDQLYRGADLINLLRGMSFLPESRNAYVLEPGTGRKIYLNLTLRTE